MAVTLRDLSVIILQYESSNGSGHVVFGLILCDD